MHDSTSPSLPIGSSYEKTIEISTSEPNIMTENDENGAPGGTNSNFEKEFAGSQNKEYDSKLKVLEN